MTDRVNMAGDVATTAVRSLGASPLMLSLVLMAVVFTGIAGYYLVQVETYRAADRQDLIKVVEDCVLRTVPVEYATKHPL